MSRLSKQVRKYVKCPQLDGGTHYGEWGALRLNQRKQIAKLCEEVNVFEDAADKFGKENFILKQQLIEKDKEIDELKNNLDDAEEHIDNLELQLREQYQLVDEKDKEIERLVKEIEWLRKCNDVLANKCCVSKNKKGE